MAEKDGGFARDLGYLDAFLNKLDAHARDRLGGAAGARLAALIDEERGRWAEIRALLDGGAPVAPERSEPAAPKVGNGDTFTVGSLINRGN